jgi:hypothetical protein
MGLMIAPCSPLLSIVWISINLAEKLQPLNHNIPTKHMTGLAIQVKKLVVVMGG